jgi:hypothetical protein
MVKVDILFGSTTNKGNGTYGVSLPFLSKSERYNGSGTALRVGSTFVVGPTTNVDLFGVITTDRFFLMSAAGPLGSSTQPWASGDYMSMSIIYRRP